VLEAAKPGFRQKQEIRETRGAADGFIAKVASRELAACCEASTELETLKRRRSMPFTQLDLALCLFACQLLMLGQNAEGRNLLLETGDAPLEEYCDKPEGEVWARYRSSNAEPAPTADGPATAGQNVNGQNLMRARAILRMAEEEGAPAIERVVEYAVNLLEQLSPCLKGEVVLSELAADFYTSTDESFTYELMLERMHERAAAASGFCVGLEHGEFWRRIPISTILSNRAWSHDGEQKTVAGWAASDGNAKLLQACAPSAPPPLTPGTCHAL
jgi:hypothetical protein